MEFRGWRWYSVRLERGRLVLHGVREEWTSPVMTAECFAGPIAECPMETVEEAQERSESDEYRGWHGCGIHSFKTLEALFGEFGGPPGRLTEVIAEVVNYGRVDEFEHGYRAEHTRILKMYLIAEKESHADFMEALRRVLETRFGVPVVVTSFDDLIAEHAPDYQERQPSRDVTATLFVNGVRHQVPAWASVQFTTTGGFTYTWPTLASASSGTTTSPNQSHRRYGNPSPSKSQPQSPGKAKKRPVAANLPANNKKWWLRR